MKKIAIATLVLVALSLGLAVQSADARGGHHFWGGFGAGAATGLVFGTLATSSYYAPPVYYGPAPVYAYPGPVCRDIVTGGFWTQVPVTNPVGFVTYRTEWVPSGMQRVCQ
jgi:hypothetical protein